MQWPYLPGEEALSQVQETFAGLNRTKTIPEGAFFRMENMSSDNFPLLTPRKPRQLFLSGGDIRGMICKDTLCYVQGESFFIGQEGYDLGLQPGDKQLVSMGAYVIIFPDKKYINTLDPSDRGDLEAYVSTTGTVSITLSMADGSDCLAQYYQPEQPEDPENMALWVDVSSSPCTLKQWAASTAMWVNVPATFVKISSPGLGKAFSVGDGIFLQGFSGTLTDALTGEPLEDTGELQALEGTAVIESKGDDFVVISGMVSINRQIREEIRLSREVPEMDFVLQRENRLWGCRYGLNSRGQVVNEIYASKLGDFKNFHCFQGISTDSYHVSVGTDGPFTGAAVFGGYPLFFKENCIHKLYGTIPANFGIQTTPCRGVEQGSGDSLAQVNGQLYYKSAEGIRVYDGAVSQDISECLGDLHLGQAVAGGVENKYYICIQSPSGEHNLLVYDTLRNLWHREDNLPVKRFCTWGRKLCALTGEGIWILNGQGEETISWMVETGPLGVYLEGAKKLRKLRLHLALGDRAWLRLYIQYDSRGPWENLGLIRGSRLQSFLLPVKPRRCDHFRLRLEGQGDGALYHFTKIIGKGSEKV